MADLTPVGELSSQLASLRCETRLHHLQRTQNLGSDIVADVCFLSKLGLKIPKVV